MGVGFNSASRGMAVAFALLLVTAIFPSCRTVKYVPVESVRTEYRDRVSHTSDSIFLKDSIYIHDRGDTVLVERWRTAYRDRWRTDTLKIELCDTIREPVPVERELTRWEKTKLEAGGFLMGALALALLAIGVIILRKFK